VQRVMAMDSMVPNTGPTMRLVGEHTNAVRVENNIGVELYVGARDHTRFLPLVDTLANGATLLFNIASCPNSWDAPGEDGAGDKFNSKKQFARLTVRSRSAAEGVDWWSEDTQVGSNEVTMARAKAGAKAPSPRTLKRVTKRCRGGGRWAIFVSAAVRVFWISRSFLF
jgi:hypothetical protein